MRYFGRSAGSSMEDIVDKLEQIIDMEQPTIITGDFNVCLQREPRNLVTTALLDLGFQQHVKSSTHIRGGIIDHAYTRDPNSQLSDLHLTQYSPYYSDHDALCMSFNIKVFMLSFMFNTSLALNRFYRSMLLLCPSEQDISMCTMHYATICEIIIVFFNSMYLKIKFYERCALFERLMCRKTN